MIVEIVGPGFDASDILRSDLLPHERWEVILGPTMLRGEPAKPISCRQIHSITKKEYAESVQTRLAKIGARVKNPAFPDTVLKGGKAVSSQLVRAGISFLKSTNQRSLLEHTESYTPVPEKHVTSFARDIRSLLYGLSAYGIHLGPSSFAASVIAKRGLVFWDFFPARKQEAASLYPAAG
jgi:hypothetical protein